MDENRQARALRERLDRELATVQADAAARQRLLTAVGARSRAESARPRDWRRLGPSVALPLAAAAVLVGVVAVPSYLRSDSGRSSAPGGPPSQVPSINGPTSAPAPSPTPTVTATPGQRRQSTEKPTPVSARTTGPQGLDITTSPERLGTYQVVTLAVRDSARAHGSMTVNWGDGSRTVPVAGVCGRAVPVPETGHTYSRSGKYDVTVVIDRCSGGTTRAHLTVLVLAVKSTAGPSTKGTPSTKSTPSTKDALLTKGPLPTAQKS